MGIGKDYKKGDPLRGAAILILTLELQGHSPNGTDHLIEGTLQDLGVKRRDVDRYIRKNRKELLDLLKEQGLG